MLDLLEVHTIPKKGLAIQYNGSNMVDIAEKFNLDYKELNSKATYEGMYGKDIRITSNGFSIELLIGDYVYKGDDGEVRVIPVYDMNDYWEIEEQACECRC